MTGSFVVKTLRRLSISPIPPLGVVRWGLGWPGGGWGGWERVGSSLPIKTNGTNYQLPITRDVAVQRLYMFIKDIDDYPRMYNADYFKTLIIQSEIFYLI